MFIFYSTLFTDQEGDQDVKLGMELVAIMTKSRIYQGENVREFLESDERLGVFLLLHVVALVYRIALENTSFIFKDPDDDDVKLTEGIFKAYIGSILMFASSICIFLPKEITNGFFTVLCLLS